MNRIAMVSIDKIVEIANGTLKPIGEDLDFFTSFYESGMKDILEEVAFKRLIKLEQTIYIENKELKKWNDANGKAIQSYNNLYEQLTTEKQKAALLDLEAAYNSVAAYECEKYFIKGFIEGYKFIKETSM